MTAYDNLSYRMQIHVICILLAIFHLAASIAEEHSAQVVEEDLLGDKESPIKLVRCVATWYWAQDTEFGRKANWANEKKPCTLLERIQVNEEAVISVGDSFDGIDGQSKSFDVKELTLPMDSMLLLEENPSEPIDENYVDYLHGAHDCGLSKDLPDVADHVFSFAPDSDSMSWFNPDNWESKYFGLDYHLAADSFRIPCSNDRVVFGDRRFDLASTNTNERSKLLSFKVNFKPSKWSMQNTTGAQKEIANIRMGTLIIGDTQYNQTEFEQLLEQYGNTLFDLSIPGQETSADQSVIINQYDDSCTGYSGDPDNECSDKAGCICGNEDSEKLQAICSFEDLLDIEDQPCHDPLPSVGYCNNICATVLTMSIDPTRFSELYVLDLQQVISASAPIPNYHHLAIVPRRVSATRYEITFINIPTENYELSFGIERVYADKWFESLNNPAIKSFYGIRSISLRSSTDWKRSNKDELFWASFIIINLSFLIMNIYGKDSSRNNWLLINRTITTRVNHWMDYRFALRTRLRTVTPINTVRDDNIADEGVVRSSNFGSSADIALVDLDDRSDVVHDKANLIPKVDRL